MRRPKRISPMAALITLLFFFGTAAAQDQGSTTVVVDGQVVSEEGAYAFSLPPEWTATDETQEGAGVHVQHEESGAYFWVETKPRLGTTDEELKALKMALPFAGGAWHLESDGYRKIGGKRAGEVVSTRELPGEPPLVLHSYVIVYKKYAYVMEFGIPKPTADEREVDRVKILETFTWLKKKK